MPPPQRLVPFGRMHRMATMVAPLGLVPAQRTLALTLSLCGRAHNGGAGPARSQGCAGGGGGRDAPGT
eukprot:14516925-Alexandrium_andersonii.AAC.1